MYCFSYNDIYKDLNYLKRELADKFDFKEYIVNPTGHHKFTDYTIDELLEFLNEKLKTEDPE